MRPMRLPSPDCGNPASSELLREFVVHFFDVVFAASVAAFWPGPCHHGKVRLASQQRRGSAEAAPKRFFLEASLRRYSVDTQLPVLVRGHQDQVCAF